MAVDQDQKTFADYSPRATYERAELIEDPAAKRIHQRLTFLAKQLLTMWVDKVNGYGVSRYRDHELDFDAWMCYSDIHRKTIRLESLTRAVSNGNQGAVKPLLDAYADMALYCLSNVEILERRVK